MVKNNLEKKSEEKNCSKCSLKRCARLIYLNIILYLLLFSLLKCGNAFNVAPAAKYIASLENPGNGQAYFGYSVGLLKNRDSKFWLLAGAPLANSSTSRNIYQPGAFYKCPIDRPDKGCEEVILDTTENNETIAEEQLALRDNAWTGASLDVDIDNNVIVCAPRWKNARYRNEYRISGACYLLGQDLRNGSAKFMDTLLYRENQIYSHFGRGVYYYAHGQCGLDVHFTNNSELLIGLPGVLNWQGSVARYVRQSNALDEGYRKWKASSIYTKSLIPNPIRTSKIQDSDFFGYSIASGKFDEEIGTYYVAGAPRGASLLGMVIVFLMKNHETQPLYIKESKQGAQIGEYFGASAAAPDLNGDGLSDLVVGAPLHSLEGLYDVGCVYVFTNNIKKEGGTVLSTEAVKLLGDIAELARFGTAIGTPGDLDNDGYEDLLIGAPYENRNTGAVYVFMGSHNGVRKEYQQKLLPEEASPAASFKGFGISFSRPEDVDGNSYPDFVVGSFLSDKAALMSTRPVVTIKGELSSNPSKLSFNMTSFTLNTCLIYQGSKVFFQSVDILAHVYISHESESGDVVASFTDSGNTEKLIDFSVRHGEKKCKPLSVSLKLEKSDANKPIIGRMDFELTNNYLKGPEDPVLNPYVSTPPALVLSFVTGCADDICRADLISSARIKEFGSENILLVGEDSKVTLEVETYNTNDPAFLPNITISIPRSIIVLPSIRDCSTSQNSSYTDVVCQLKNPLKRYEKDSVLLELDLSQLDDSTSDINIKVHSRSAAEMELNPDNNHFSFSIKVEKNASIQVTGWSRPEQHIFERINDQENSVNKFVQLEHIFSITKSGVTPLREVEVIAYLPYNLKLKDGEEIRLLDQIEHKMFYSQSSTCALEYKSSETQNKTNENILQSSDEKDKIHKRYENSFTSLSCTSKYVKCSSFKCKIGPWKRALDVATLSVSFHLNLSALNQAISLNEGFSLFSLVEANIVTHNDASLIYGNRFDFGRVQTVFNPGSLPTKPFVWWIYLLAVLGGLFVFLIIAFYLYQVGFFERKSREELKAQKATLFLREDESN